jgi:hypothetical protein
VRYRWRRVVRARSVQMPSRQRVTLRVQGPGIPQLFSIMSGDTISIELTGITRDGTAVTQTTVPVTITAWTN